MGKKGGANIIQGYSGNKGKQSKAHIGQQLQVVVHYSRRFNSVILFSDAYSYYFAKDLQEFMLKHAQCHQTVLFRLKFPLIFRMRKLLNAELIRLSAEEMKTMDKIPIVIVLDNVRSHLNVGSVFRTSDAFLIEAIYLCGITGTPPHRDINKTALGATETVTWMHFADTNEAIRKLKSEGYIIASVEQAEGAVALNEFLPKSSSKYAVVFGNEVEGVSQSIVDHSDIVIDIPQFGTKHSLNVSVSAGIVVWDMVSKLQSYK